jgi:NCS2 family nucleobase:cation symporter-2
MRQGYGTVAGAVIIGGIFEGVLGLSAKYWKRLISPIVSAVVVTAIGLSLLPTAAQSFGGGTAEDFGSMPNLLTGSATLLTCVVWKIRAKGIHKQLVVLAGLTAGFLLSLVLGHADLSHLLDHG